MPKFLNLPKYTGFTLVEVMLTVGIIVILTATVLPSVGSFSDSNLLNQALQNMASDIENARFKALSGAYNGTTRVYWGFNCTTLTTYSLSAYNETAPYSVISSSTRTLTTPSGVTISCSGTPVVFSRLSGTPVMGGNAVITLTKGSITGRVTVNPQGIISVSRD